MSNINPEVLFLVLADEIIGIDFKRLQCQPQWNQKHKDQPNTTPIYFRMSVLEHFRNTKEVVVGFTHMKLGSEVYLLGGEKLKSGTKFDKVYINNHPECHGGFSRKVFQLKKTRNAFTLERCTHMDQHYGKSSPMVANVGSKIYVISGAPYYLNNHVTLGSFEVYNLSEDYWGVLNDAPPYSSNFGQPNGQILGHIVLGQKLLIKDSSGKAYFFDTKIHTRWQELDENVIRSYFEVGLSLPTNGVSVPFFPGFNNDFQLVISREGFEDAYAMIIHTPTCSLMYYQSLKEVFKGRYPIAKNGDRIQFFGGKNIFLLLPNKRICAMWVGFDHFRRLRLFVTIFALELLCDPMVWTSSSSLTPFQNRVTMSYRASETTFLKTKIVHTFDCIVKDATAPNYVFDAFFY